jgi:hypothetical protein
MELLAQAIKHCQPLPNAEFVLTALSRALRCVAHLHTTDRLKCWLRQGPGVCSKTRKGPQLAANGP